MVDRRRELLEDDIDPLAIAVSLALRDLANLRVVGERDAVEPVEDELLDVVEVRL
jgi:hypothetical protein